MSVLSEWQCKKQNGCVLDFISHWSLFLKLYRVNDVDGQQDASQKLWHGIGHTLKIHVSPGLFHAARTRALLWTTLHTVFRLTLRVHCAVQSVPMAAKKVVGIHGARQIEIDFDVDSCSKRQKIVKTHTTDPGRWTCQY
jgi:hypothetical protein